MPRSARQPQRPGAGRHTGKGLPVRVPRGNQSPLDCGPPMRRLMSIVLSPQVCGNLLQHPRKITLSHTQPRSRLGLQVLKPPPSSLRLVVELPVNRSVPLPARGQGPSGALTLIVLTVPLKGWVPGRWQSLKIFHPVTLKSVPFVALKNKQIK